MELVEWQRIGKDGLIECWFVHPCLDWINEQDWSDKNILMYGAGMGDCSLAKKCKHLTVIERNEEWIIKAAEYVGNNGAFVEYIHRPCNDCSGQEKYYCEIPNDRRYDIIIVDDAYRYECIVEAVNYRPELLIVDNFDQDFVFICPSAVELLKDYKGQLFIQENHTNHNGKCWKTGVWNIK